jgi:hypothetical protein
MGAHSASVADCLWLPDATMRSIAGVPATKTALFTRLGPERIQRLAETCCSRLKTTAEQNEQMFRARDNYLLQSEDNFDWRKTLGERDSERPTAIFAKQNDSINIIGGFCEYLSAKTVDDLMGSEPYFSILPEGKADKKLAETMQLHSEWRVRKSDFDATLAAAIPAAYALGEQVVKIKYSKKTQFFETRRNVMVDPATGKYVLTADGENIFDDDEIVQPAPEPVMPPPPPMPQQAEGFDPATGEQPPADPDIIAQQQQEQAPDAPPPGPQYPHPAKDPSLDLSPFMDETGQWTYKEAFVAQEKPCGEPLECTALHHRDFLCSNTAVSLEKSDFVAHIYDLRISKAKAQWGLSKDVLDKITDDTHAPKSSLGKPREGTAEAEDEGAQPLHDEDNDPLVQFAECYVPVNVQGHRAKVLVIVAVKSNVPVFADYLANVTPDGVLPFFMIRPFPVRNRAYGRGLFEIYSYAQEFIERQLNYIAYRNRHHANPIRLIRRDMLTNIAEGQDIPVTPDTGLDLAKNADPKQAITFVEYPDLDSRTWELMQLMMQVVQLRSGITSAAQGGVESLPQNSTATGIEAILSSGNTIHRLPVRHVRKQIEGALTYCLKLIYTYFDADETFTYLEGENIREITLAAEKIQDIHFDIRLTMTRFRQKEQRESAKEAIMAVNEYLNNTREEDKPEVRALYVDILKSLGIQDADRIIRAPLPPQPQAPPPL